MARTVVTGYSGSSGAAGRSNASQPLPSKDAALFQTLMKYYEEKMYNRAIKVADEILKKHPNHGETLSMKAMVLSYTSAPKPEVLDIARQGLRGNVSSSTCWHVLGILHRSEKNYSEALRYFRQAHRLSPENLLLLRDLATLQIQERDLPGFLETRRKIFFARPNLRLHWTTFAVAHHLAGNYLLAAHLARTALRHFRSKKDRYGSIGSDRPFTFEDGELILYEAFLLEEVGSYSEAIRCLEHFTDLPDKIGRLEALGRLYIYMEDYAKAHTVFAELFQRCRANRRYLLCLLATLPSFVQRVRFPPTPVEYFASLREGGTEDVSHDVSGDTTGDDTVLFCLSPYTLRSPQLSAVDSSGWPLHTTHLLYPTQFLSKSLPCCNDQSDGSTGIADIMFLQLRRMTEEEESTFTTWLFTDVFVEDKGNANDGALRFALDLISSRRRFVYFADRLLRPKVLKGAPFATNLVKALCRDTLKKNFLQELLEGYVAALRTTINATTAATPSRFLLGNAPQHPPELENQENNVCPKCKLEETGKAAAPACFVIALVSLALFYDAVGDFSKALAVVNEAITHTPSLVEVYQVKAQVLKHMGGVRDAACAASQARDMDLADRFLNTQCVSYSLAAHDLETADKLAVFYATNGKREALTEMQCMRFELRYAKVCLEMGKLNLGIKHLYDVIKHFEEMNEDQFDFHLYAFHQGTLRSFVQFLRMQNRLHAHKSTDLLPVYWCRYFRQAVALLVPLLFTLREKEHSTSQLHSDCQLDGAVESVSAAPSPSSELKAGKKKKKAEKQEVAPSVVSDSFKYPFDDPLSEAWRLVDKLRRTASLDVKTQQLVYRVATQQEKWLLAIQSVYRLWILVNRNAYHFAFSPVFSAFLYHVVPLFSLQASISGSDRKTVDLENNGESSDRKQPYGCDDPKLFEAVQQGVRWILERCLTETAEDTLIADKTLIQNTLTGRIQPLELARKYFEGVFKVNETRCVSIDYLNAAVQCLGSAQTYDPSFPVGCHNEWILDQLTKICHNACRLRLKSFVEFYKTITETLPVLHDVVEDTLSRAFPQAEVFELTLPSQTEL